ncbi:MAG: TrkA family potassium uptake protein [Chloroflexi bacterium]|nr:TrkA family potassium uptake protein [Chloroflexota bacterium]
MGKSVLIVGGGRVGTALASLLLDRGCQVRVVEARRDIVSRLQGELPPGVPLLGSGTDPNVLEAAGIRQANVAAAITSEDEVNLVVSSLARFEFNVARTVARVNRPKNAWMFTPVMGVDVALNQADLMAHVIADEVSLSDLMALLKLRKGQYSLVEQCVEHGSVSSGKTLRDLALPPQSAVVAISRQGQLLIPCSETVLQTADEVLAVVHTSQRGRLAAIFGHAKSK